jgi:hypothetical protein
MAGQALVARLVPTHIRVAENTAGGTIYAAVYVLYAPSLAFSLFIVWGEYREAQRTTNTEADTLADLYQLAKQFPEPERHQIQDLSSWDRVERPRMPRSSQEVRRLDARAEVLIRRSP